MTQKQFNHQQRVKEDATSGIDRIIAKRLIHADTVLAKGVATWREELAEAVVTRLLRHYTIRPRNRK